MAKTKSETKSESGQQQKKKEPTVEERIAAERDKIKSDLENDRKKLEEERDLLKSEREALEQQRERYDKAQEAMRRTARPVAHVPDYDPDSPEEIRQSVGAGQDTGEPAEAQVDPPPGRIIRPSELPKKDNEGRPVDQYKFLRENGLPNPLRRYRVSATGTNSNKYPPLDIEAVDGGDAVRQFLRAYKVTKTHQVNCTTTVIEE